MCEQTKSKILIVGGGIGGMKSSLTLAKLGFDVILVEKEKELGGLLNSLYSFYQDGISPEQLLNIMKKEISESEKITVYKNAYVKKIMGEIGDFSVSIRQNDELLELKSDGIILAVGFNKIFPDEFFDIRKKNNTITLLELEKLLIKKSFPNISPKTNKRPIALFINGLIGGNSISISSALKNSIILKEKFGYRVFIASSQMKVDSPDLEQLYGKSRSKGVVFFRLGEQLPIIKQENDDTEVFIEDYQLGDGTIIKIPCDLLIIEEKYKPAMVKSMFDFNLEIKTDILGFYQQDNVHLVPVETNRKGILAVGGCRMVNTINGVINDAKSAAAIIVSMLKEKRIHEDYIEVNPERCALCLTCQRYCPHGAITYDRVPIFSPTGCQICGICAMECPNNALKILKREKESVI